MSLIQIRTVQVHDFEAWHALWLGYLHFYEVEIDERVTLASWGRFLDPAEPMHAALATMEGRAVGLVHSIYHRSAWTIGDYCYLQDLFVADDARGSGVGRALIEHVYAEAERSGACRVYWTTHESNHGAMQLYDRIATRAPFVQYRKRLA